QTQRTAELTNTLQQYKAGLDYLVQSNKDDGAKNESTLPNRNVASRIIGIHILEAWANDAQLNVKERSKRYDQISLVLESFIKLWVTAIPINSIPVGMNCKHKNPWEEIAKKEPSETSVSREIIEAFKVIGRRSEDSDIYLDFRRLSLKGLDLKGANLRHINFSYSDL